MPCQGPSPEEQRALERYERKMRNPKFRKKEEERIAKEKYEWENGGRQKWEKEIKEERERVEEEVRRNKKEKIKEGKLEVEAFGSFMTVFLCKAMKLIETNNLMRHIYQDMEWWWEEHKERDKNGKSSKSKDELYERLIWIEKHYNVKDYK